MKMIDVMKFAEAAHKTQKRKYSGEPYISHPAQVAALVHAVGGTDHMVAAAWLHDTIEDCGVTFEQLDYAFGVVVATYVQHLTDVYTDPKQGNRNQRKKLEAIRLAGCPYSVQTIKYADFISNTQSIVAHDPSFAAVYLDEKAFALSLMVDGDATLRQMALDTLREGQEYLVQLNLSKL